MKTYEQYMADAPRSHRVWAVLTLLGVVGLVAAVTGVSRPVAFILVGGLFLAVNTFIWLRENPTLKQIERRRKRAAGTDVPDDDAPASRG